MLIEAGIQGAEDVFGHAVSRLIEDASTLDKDLGDLYRTGAALNKLYIPTHNPNGLPGGLSSEAYTQDEAESALRNARKILDAVTRRLPSG